MTDLSTVSFAIRTSLTAIYCYSARLCRDGIRVGVEERERWCSVIQSACLELADNADKLLVASRLGQVTLAPEKNTVNLWDFLHEVVDNASFYIKEGVSVEYRTKIDREMEIEVNPPLLSTVLLELLKNAFQNTSDGVVMLGTELDKSEGKLRISVSDHGAGIPADHRDKVFDWFYKVDPNKPGLGLGLPLCREMAALLGGEVRLDVNGQGGTMVCLLIPY